jgi:hypothetical protein
MKAALPRVAFREALRGNPSVTVSGLRKVLKKYPGAGLDDDVNAEVHRLFVAAMEKFRTQAAEADPTLIPFFEQMLATLEASGNSTLQLRFTRPTSDELANMDRLLAAEAVKRGRVMAPAAPWFTPSSDAGREQRIVQGLQQGLSAIFPSDVLQISVPPHIDQNQPLMDITYQIGGSGQYYEATNSETPIQGNKHMFVGLICNFMANVSLPNQDPGWHFNLSVLPPQTFQVQYQKANAGDNEAPVDRVYSVMAERAFDELHVKLRDVLFRPGSQAYQKVVVGRVK